MSSQAEVIKCVPFNYAEHRLHILCKLKIKHSSGIEREKKNHNVVSSICSKDD